MLKRQLNIEDGEEIQNLSDEKIEKIHTRVSNRIKNQKNLQDFLLKDFLPNSYVIYINFFEYFRQAIKHDNFIAIKDLHTIMQDACYRFGEYQNRYSLDDTDNFQHIQKTFDLLANEKIKEILSTPENFSKNKEKFETYLELIDDINGDNTISFFSLPHSELQNELPTKVFYALDQHYKTSTILAKAPKLALDTFLTFCPEFLQTYWMQGRLFNDIQLNPNLKPLQDMYSSVSAFPEQFYQDNQFKSRDELFTNFLSDKQQSVHQEFIKFFLLDYQQYSPNANLKLLDLILCKSFPKDGARHLYDVCPLYIKEIKHNQQFKSSKNTDFNEFYRTQDIEKEANQIEKNIMNVQSEQKLLEHRPHRPKVL